MAEGGSAQIEAETLTHQLSLAKRVVTRRKLQAERVDSMKQGSALKKHDAMKLKSEQRFMRLALDNKSVYYGKSEGKADTTIQISDIKFVDFGFSREVLKASANSPLQPDVE